MTWILLAGLTALRLVVAAALPLAPDEAYYWVWSRALAPGYLDHPPMVALWIRAGTILAGPFLEGGGPLGVRLLAPPAALLGSLLLRAAARDLAGPAAGGRAVWLLNATLLFGAGAVTMTPDTPLLFFWTAALWALARLHRTGRPGWWLLVGPLVGLAAASKYSGVLLAPAIGLWLLLWPGPRRWLRCWQSWAGGVLALLVFAPVLAWNAAHGWASFAKQGGRNLAWVPSEAARHLAELVGGQIGLATPLIFLLGAAGLVAAGRRAVGGDPAAGLLALLSLVPLLVFLEHALGDRVQANWPAVIYPSAVIAAAGSGVWRRLDAPAVALGFGVTALVIAQAIWAPLPLPARRDPTARLAGWTALARAVDRTAGANEFIAADSYGDAALLARDLPDRQVIGIEPRWVLFALPDARPTIAGRAGLLVRSARRSEPPDPAGWRSLALRGEIARSRDGEAVEIFKLYDVVGGEGGASAVILPHWAGAP